MEKETYQVVIQPARILRCPLCFEHLTLRLNIEEAGKHPRFWSGWECQGECEVTWTNLDGRKTPR